MKLSRLIQVNKVRKDKALNLRIDTLAVTDTQWFIIASIPVLTLLGYLHVVNFGVKVAAALALLPTVCLLPLLFFVMSQASIYPRGPQKWRKRFLLVLIGYAFTSSVFMAATWLYQDSVGLSSLLLLVGTVVMALYLSNLLIAYPVANLIVTSAIWLPHLLFLSFAHFPEHSALTILMGALFLSAFLYAKHQSSMYWENCEALFLLEQKLVSVEASYKENDSDLLLTSRGLLTVTQSLKYSVSNIYAGISLLHDNNSETKFGTVIKGSLSAINVLLKQINGLADYAVLASGMAGIHKSYCNLIETLKPQFIELSRYAAERNIDFNVIVASDFPSRIYADPGRTADTIFLLIMEIISHNKNGNMLIELNFEPLAGPQGNLVVIVNDVQADSRALTENQRKQLTPQKLGSEFTLSSELVELQGGSLKVYHQQECIAYQMTMPSSEKAVLIQSRAIQKATTKVTFFITGMPVFMRDFVSKEIVSQGLLFEFVELGDSYLQSDALISSGENQNVLIIYLRSDQKIIAAIQEIATKAEIEHCTLAVIANQIQSEEYEVDKKNSPIAQQSFVLLTKPLNFVDIFSINYGVKKFGTSDRATGVASGSESINQQYALCGKILVVEDQRVNQMVATGMLKKMGYSTCLANNGEEALALLDTEDFDLILMDCQMAGMDGFSATQAIREKEKDSAELKHIPIVALTAHSAAEDQTRCMAVGMDDCLTKPVQYTELESSLRRWLGSSDLNNRLN